VLFLQSIPYALTNLQGILGSVGEAINLPHLTDIFDKMLDPDSGFHQKLIQLSSKENSDKLNKNNELSLLKVRINSFSFKRSLPEDPTGNGGGFVFDCRALPNPGRLPEFRNKTGMDPEVVGFLENEPAVREFVSKVTEIVAASVQNYKLRGFSNLMVSFGCTGGQHRSVYCAEQLSRALRSVKDVAIELHHIEQELK
jgi:RNase adaptor protein for sRNA GlmZ degradation